MALCLYTPYGPIAAEADTASDDDDRDGQNGDLTKQHDRLLQLF